MTTRLLLSTILFVLLVSCDKSSEIFIDNNAQYLVNSWTENYKEGSWTSGPMTFKPSEEADMTLFRTRNKLDVRADGSVTYTISSKMDPNWSGQPVIVTGTWTYDTVTGTLVISDDGVIVYAFGVLFSAEDKVKLDYKETIDIRLPR